MTVTSQVPKMKVAGFLFGSCWQFNSHPRAFLSVKKNRTPPPPKKKKKKDKQTPKQTKITKQNKQTPKKQIKSHSYLAPAGVVHLEMVLGLAL